MTSPPDAQEAARRHLQERIEAFIAGYEANGGEPDAFAGEYLVRALASLSVARGSGEGTERLCVAVDGGAPQELRAGEARTASLGHRQPRPRRCERDSRAAGSRAQSATAPTTMNVSENASIWALVCSIVAR